MNKKITSNLSTVDMLLVTALWYFAFSSPANAYFDSTTAAYFLQLIFAFGTAILFSIKNVCKNRLKIKRPNNVNE